MGLKFNFTIDIFKRICSKNDAWKILFFWNVIVIVSFDGNLPKYILHSFRETVNKANITFGGIDNADYFLIA